MNIDYSDLSNIEHEIASDSNSDIIDKKMICFQEVFCKLKKIIKDIII